MNGIKNKKVLITGGSRGIGKEVIKIMLNSGAEVFSVSRRSAKIKNSKFHECCMNLLNISSVSNKTINKFKSIRFDILINNIGTNYGVMPFSDFPYKEMEKQMFLNINVHLYFLKNFNYQKVVFVNSVLSQIGVPNVALYCACKSFIYTLNDSLRREGVDSLVICPYKVNTTLFPQISDFMVLDKKDVAFEIVNAIDQRKKSIFVPFILLLIPFILSMLPLCISDKIVIWLFKRVVIEQ